MNEPIYNSTLITRYLLGDLPPADQDKFEEKYFADDELFVELLDAKDQLISDYLGGSLSSGDRELFERRFIAQPDCRQEVELGAFLQSPAMPRSVSGQSVEEKRQRRWWQDLFDALRVPQPLVAAAAVLLIVMAAGLWYAARFSPEDSQPDSSMSSAPAQAGPASISLTLRPGQTRSSGATPKAVVGQDTKEIELLLVAGTEKYQSYQASLHPADNDNEVIQSGSSFKVETDKDGNRIVAWKLEASGLFGDYQVKLSGRGPDNAASNIGKYYFNVRNQ
jgi:hypothetical protein